MTQPFDFARAREASQEASAAQERAEQQLVEAGRDYARKEQLYRVALRAEIMRQHTAGVAWTVCGDIARGDERVAQLKFERDLAESVYKSADQAAWRHKDDRKDLLRFIGWSERAAFLGEREPNEDAVVFGGRRAA